MGVNPAEFASSVWGSQEMKKILKKDEKKGKGVIAKAISEYHLAHMKAKEAIAGALSQEIGIQVDPNSQMVENAVNAISLTKIFERKGEAEELVPTLKQELQKYEADSPEALLAIANALSIGSKKKVPTDDKVVSYDRDVISMKTIENPDLLFS